MGYSGEPNVNMKALKWVIGRQKGQDLRAGTTRKTQQDISGFFNMSQGMQAVSRKRKGKRTDSPLKPLEGSIALLTLWF